jgi:hypothetical protein
MHLRPTTRALLLLVAVSGGSLASLWAQLGPAAPLSQAGVATAQNSALYPVAGIVINSVTGQPIPRALVQIAGPEHYSVLTGADGKFHLDRVPQGQFPITVQKPGFFSERELTRVFGSVQAGPGMAQVVLKLVPEGVIYGRITDAEGESLEGAFAKVFYPQIVDGRRSFQQQFGAQTNGEGEFRIFDLRPGTYYVGVGTEGNTFYPGVRDIESAAPIRVAPAEPVRLDFRIQADVKYRISGRVSGMPPAASVNLSLVGSNLGYSTKSFAGGRDGSFAQIMPAGRYVLQASAVLGDNQLAASVPLDLTANIEGVRLNLAPTATIPIQVDFALTQKLNPQLPDGQPGVSVRLIPKDSDVTHQEYDAGIRLDLPPGQRTFAVANVPSGAYRVAIMPYGEWYVRAARRGGTDLLTQDLFVNSGGIEAPIEVMLRDDFASLRGTVSTVGRAAPCDVLLIPERAQEPAIMIAVDETGRFQIDSMAPGGYTLFAFDRVEDLEYRNPEAMRPYATGAQSVQLLPGGQVSVNLQLQNRREY